MILIEIDNERRVLPGYKLGDNSNAYQLNFFETEPILPLEIYHNWVISDKKQDLPIQIVSPYRKSARFALQAHSYDSHTDILKCKILSIGEIPCDEDYIHHLVDRAPFFAFAKDHEGKFIYANKKLLRSYGCENNNQIIGKFDSDFLNNSKEAKFVKEDDLWVINNQSSRFVSHEVFTPINSGIKHNLKTWKFLNKKKTIPPILLGFAIDNNDYVKEREFTRSILRGATGSSFPDIANSLCEFICSLDNVRKLIDHVALVRNDYKTGVHQILGCSINPDKEGSELLPIEVGEEWNMGNKNSLHQKLVNSRRYSKGNIQCDSEVKPRHSWVKSLAAVSISTDPSEDVAPQESLDWGFISCISSTKSTDQEMRRVVEELEHFADQASKLFIICYNNSIKDKAEVKMFSMYVEGHEQDKRIGMSIVGVLNEEIEKLKKNGYETKNLESVLRHSRKLSSAFDLSRSISKFAEAYTKQGEVYAQDVIRSRINLEESKKTIALNILLEELVKEQNEFWKDDTPGLNVSLNIENLDHQVFVERNEVLIRSGISNLIANACAHVASHFFHDSPKVELSCRNTRHKVVLEIQHLAKIDSSLVETFERLNEFYSNVKKRPCDCVGWGSAVIKTAVTAYRGGTRIKFCRRTNKIVSKTILKTRYEKANNCS